MSKGKLTGSAPILLVADVVSSAEWYREKLGFSYELYGDPVSFCILNRDNFHLMLREVKNISDIKPHWKIVEKMWNVYFWVDDVEAFYKEFQESGATIDYELHLKPYGVKEFGIIDPDEYDIAFGQVMR